MIYVYMMINMINKILCYIILIIIYYKMVGRRAYNATILPRLNFDFTNLYIIYITYLFILLYTLVKYILNNGLGGVYK